MRRLQLGEPLQHAPEQNPGHLQAVDGASPCDYFATSVAPSRIACEQYFMCGDCQYFLKAALGQTWEITATNEECPSAQYCSYVLGPYVGSGGDL